MPLDPLPDPDDLREHLTSLAKGTSISSFLFTSIIGINSAQMASVALLPFSPNAFRRFNRGAAALWWGWCVSISKDLLGVRLEITGDEVPDGENAVVICNHQDMADITFLMVYARTKGRLGDMKYLVKDALKYVPGVGWGMLFLDCVFVKRDWAKDQETIRRTFSRLRDNDVPVWLISFSEGTRMTPSKLARAQAFARKRGLTEPKHVQIPRPTGFVATVEGLRDHVDAVYDITIGYEDGVPTLWQYIKGLAPRAHLHVRRHPIDSLPTDSAGLKTWILDRFTQKDALLDHYYAHGHFPT